MNPKREVIALYPNSFEYLVSLAIKKCCANKTAKL